MIKIIDNFSESVDSLDELYSFFYKAGTFQFDFISANNLNKPKSEIERYLFDIIKKVIEVEPSFKAKAGYECWVNVLTLDDNYLNYHVDCDEDTSEGVVTPAKRTITLYLGPHEEIKGGALVVNSGGMNHFNSFDKESIYDVKNDLDSGEWITIPYRFNRAVLFGSDLPHAVLPITSIPQYESRISLNISSWDKNIKICQ
jgi:hypothetical protein